MPKIRKIEHEEILNMAKRHRTNFINSLSGFKSLNLVGTVSSKQQYNLAPVSSVIHVGANPPSMGVLFRPNTVSRHSLENIIDTKDFTLNHITKEFYRKAHQCSARYMREESEFQEVGLTEEFHLSKAPFVKEAVLKIGLTLKEKIDIKVNGTHFLIGEVREVILPESIIKSDGYNDLQEAGSLTVSGLDSYYRADFIERLPYAKR